MTGGAPRRRVLFVLVVGAAGLALLLALGAWQLRRLAWKEGILAGIAARMDAPLAALPEAPEEGRDEYRLLTVSGEIGPGEIRVLASRRDSGPGVLVIAPLVLADGRRILLERGFVPEARAGETRAGGPVTVTGNLLWPDDRTSWTPAPDRARNLWFARDVAAMAGALGTEPVLLVARTPTGEGILPVPVSVSIPNDHLEYALTWFGLAAVWAGMLVLWLRRTAAAARPGPAP